MKIRILLLEQPDVVEVYTDILEHYCGWDVTPTTELEDAWKQYQAKWPDLIITTPDYCEELAERVHKSNAAQPIVVWTAGRPPWVIERLSKSQHFAAVISKAELDTLKPIMERIARAGGSNRVV